MLSKAILISSFIASAASTTLYTEDSVMQHNMWNHFKSNFGKTYSTADEESLRFNQFVANLKVADERNLAEKKAGGSAVHGVTQFTDLSQEEFTKRYLTSDPTLGKPSTLAMKPMDDLHKVNQSMGLVDWTGKYTTGVKNQGSCGSCWAFSATEQIESDAIRTLGAWYELSPEQIVQCDPYDGGCNGGWPKNAYSYVNQAGGLETAQDYPYTAAAGVCRANSNLYRIGVSNYGLWSGNDIENSMGGYTQQAGPISICLDASNFNSYTGGVMWSCGKTTNHCVQAVGVDVGGYWKVRNSWGAGWGESGHIRLGFGGNVCNLVSSSTVVTVFKK
jgi:C1A family cysteine protease